MIRSSPSRLALSYIALGVLALGLFAIPLWYGYRANLGTFRAYVPGAEMQRLVDIFHRDGPQAAAAAVESYLPSMPRDEVLVFADPQKRRLAGSLPAWPAEVPDVPGTYGLVIGLGGDASMRVVTSHVTLPGGYQLLMGRESVRFDSLVARFWYGIGGAVAVVLTLGLVFAWLLRRERGQLEALVAQRTAALRLSEERYARAMEATEAGHWEWDLVANEVFHSARFRELYGVALEEKFASRDAWKARQPVSRAERERQERALQAAIADPAKSYDVELFFEPRPGEVRWLRSRGKVFRAQDGRPLRIAGATTDITAQKLAQEALRRSEERYARVMQASEDGFWEWVVASDEFYASPRMLALYGLPPDTVFRSRNEFLSRFPFHPEDLDLWHRAVAAHLAGKTARIDIEVRAKLESDTRWIRLTALCQRGASGAEERWTGSVSDVTERRRAQEALRRSEERYARAMEGSDAGHWDWNIVTDEMFVSERAREMLALPAGELPATRAEIMALVPQHPEDRLTMHEHVRVGIGTGNFERDYRVIPREGAVRWLHSRAKVYKDARGAAVRMTGSLTDITERKRAADALKRSEERFALAVAGSNDGIWDWDIVTNEMFLSERAQRIYGLEPGRTIRPRAEWRALVKIHPDDAEGQLRSVEDYLAGRSANYEGEWRVLHPDGRYRWIRIRGTCVRDAEGRPTRFAGSVSDIDERRCAEEALRRSESYLTEAMRLGRAGSFAYDARTHRNVHWSSTTYEIFDFDPAGGLPLPEEVYRRVHPEDVERVRDARGKAMTQGADYDANYRIVRRDGSIRHLHASGHPVLDASGEVVELVGVVTDVTERKRAEEELRDSEARFRALTELSSDWYWEQDEQLRFSYMSDQAPALGGYPEESTVGKTRWELPGLRAVSCSWDEHRTLLAARKAFRDLELARTRPDGSVAYLGISGAPIFDARGVFRGYRGVGRSITERKRAEEELRESEARFRALTELSSDWYWRQDEKLRFTYVSNQVADRGRYPREWVIGKTRWELRGVTPLSSGWEEHQAVLAARQPFREFEYSRIGEDGSTEYVSISGAPIFDEAGEFRGYQGVGRTITERRRAEAELRSRQEMLELAQKAARAVAFEWRIGEGEGENRWSPDLEAMYGLAPGSYDGTYETWKKLVHPADWPAVKEAIGHAHRTGDVDAEYRVRHADGSIHWLHAKGRMFFDARGEPARMVGFMHDVTERRHAEEELKAMERKLRQAQRLEAMGTLAGGIAHDFNNILGAILGYGEMALRDAAAGSRLRRDLDSIMAAGERGRALVDRVLAFSRSGVGERVPVHVEKVVREALDLVSAKLPPSVTLHAKLHAPRAAMLGDATQVHQVVMNLAANAVQAMPAGGTLRIALRVARLDAPRTPVIDALGPAEYLVLEVADTGTGIAPEIMERIFDPFFTTKEVGTGTGLGLSLVHGIVTELGGAIDVASEPGKGATFTVYLPRAGEAPDAVQAEELALPRGGGQRVLVVDDEEPLVRLATRTLEELGYAPIGFTSSAAALAAFRADPQRFDALITDERMPGMSGSALIREVRGIRDGIPIVMMSGYVGGRTATLAREAGAEEVLKKPLSARDLAASLARVLANPI